MSDIKITDLVPQETIDQVKELNTEMKSLLGQYTDTAKELAKGLEINVKVIGDVDKLQSLLVEKNKEAAQTTERLNSVLREQSQVMANTTNTISRQLMEQERRNKLIREEYKDGEKVKQMVEDVSNSYDGMTRELAKVNTSLKAAKKAQSDLDKQLKFGRISYDQYIEKQGELIAKERELALSKSQLQQVMKIQEKLNSDNAGSYNHLSHQLELLKNQYKDMDDNMKNSEMGREFEKAIQDLDAHLKDLAADMGEFQRNVGNYAIAGQNGVVTTESVVNAMNQEALTVQDLIDQTKILEEAKARLNTSDSNYQSTLDAINAKLAENKARLTDVSDILGKEATSVAEAEAQNKRLNEAIKNLDLRSAEARASLEKMRAQIERNSKMMRQATGDNEKFAGSMLNLIGINANFGSSLQGLSSGGNFLSGMTTKLKGFGTTLTGLLSNPWVLSFLGLAGIGAGVKWWYDYNKGLIEASRLTENFTGLVGEAADKVTADIGALADHMGKGYKDTIGAANTLVQQFGISWDKAMALMEDGLQAGADIGGRMVENINQFAPALRDAGVSAEEFMAILSETRNGIFSEQGVQDIIKAGTRLRAQTKQISAALDAVGISSEKMQKDLASGQITMLDAVQQVSQKLKELPENSQQAGNLMKQVFGRTAAEGGTQLIKSIADVNTNLDEQIEKMGELGRVNREHMEAQKQLSETLSAVFKMSGTNFEQMTTQTKTYLVNGLTKLIQGTVDLINYFIDLYNESAAVRYIFNSIGAGFKNQWAIIKLVVRQMIDSFKALGDIVKDIFTGNWDEIADHYVKGVMALKDNVQAAVVEITDNVEKVLSNTSKDHVERLSYTLDGDTSAAESNVTDNDGNNPLGGKGGKGSKDAEKRAKEELKVLQKLEEAKIALMADGHEKEIALIRLSYKKKLDAIKGHSAKEEELRVQLALECEKAVREADDKYYTELAKINLANRLASVEKGSKEEYDLKIAQLEKEREAEIKAAQKNGADVNLINAKFNKQRLELQKEYSDSYMKQIEANYAAEQEDADTNNLLSIVALKKNYDERVKLAKGNNKKIENAERDFQNEMADLQEQYAIDTARRSVDMLEELLKNEDLTAEARLQIEKDLAKARANLADAVVEHEINSNARRKKDYDDFTDDWAGTTNRWLQAASDAINAINDLFQTLFDAQIERIEALQEANEAEGEKEQERITELVSKKVITEEEGEARKRAAEAKTARENEKLEKKKQELKIKQAKWDKANSLAQAAINTAMGITSTIAQMGMPAAIPFVAIAGALGAIQIATILATPLPQYARGTDYHKGGPAIVGDGGKQEVVMFNGGAWLTPDTPTLVDMPKSAQVFPSIEDYARSLAMIGDTPYAAEPALPQVVVNNDYNDLQREVKDVAQLIRTQTKIQHRDAYLAKYELFKNRI